jgi:hypothetical protein
MEQPVKIPKMTALPKLQRLAATACLSVLSVACVAQTESNKQQPSRQTAVRSDATEHSNRMEVSIERHATTVEVRVVSQAPFQDHAMPPVLVIGDRAFGRSNHPPDGQANVLIFTIEAAEYDALPEGAEVSVGYLSPSARLAPEQRLSRSATTGASGPRIEPNQVQANTRRRAGVLHTRNLEVTQ